MSRVDVVTGGASAVYGSDAITGVVNFVLDKNFNGVKYEANSGISEYADGFKYKVECGGGHGCVRRQGGISKAPSNIEMLTACCSLPGLYSQTGYSSYNSGNTPNNPVTNVQHGGQTVSTFSGLVSGCNCAYNGYEFGQPGILTPANLGHYPRGARPPSPVGGDGAHCR